MLSRLTGGLRPWSLSLEGKLHETQPQASVGVAAQAIGQNGRPLVEPGAFFVDGSYGLRINSWNSLVGVGVTVRMRFLGSDGRIRDNEFTHTPNSNRTKATSDFPLGVGFPLNITAFASAGTPLVGQTFLQVQLISGVGGATTLLGTLLQDYVTSVQALAWPGSPIRSSIEGGGVTRFISGTVPAAGVEMAESVPTGARWTLLALQSGLNTAAGGGARQPALRFNCPTQATMASIQAVTIAGGASQAYSWSQGLGSNQGAAGFVSSAPLPIGVQLLAGYVIASTTNNLAAGDQWSGPQYIVREWLEAAA